MTSTGTFSERIDVLRKMVGSGKIVASCEVNQRYAQYQHEHLELHHPRGGEALYLQKPLMENYHSYLEDYAKTVLSDGGQPAMRRAAEHLSDEVEIHAPVEFSDLRRSGHPQVEADGHVVYDRPPKQARLTEAELRAKSRAALRARWNAGLPVFWTKGRGAGRKVIHVPAGKARKPW